MKRHRLSLFLIGFHMAFFAAGTPLLAQTPVGTAFTYQGRLTDAGAPADGSYDLEFKLFDAAGGGGQVGSTVTLTSVGVTNGLFTVSLDFGTGVFAGDRRWLEMGVRPGGTGGAFTTLVPRQELTAGPNAIYALAAASATTVAGLSCSSGQVLKWSGASWTCGTDVDTNSGGTVTSVGTSAGLTGGPITGSGTIGIADGGVTTPKIADNTITAGKIGTGQVVKSLNGLTDLVTLAATGAASLSASGNTITLNVTVEVPSGTYILGDPGDTTLIAQGYEEVYQGGQDTWTSTVGAPTGRSNHTAVWTGTQMIVWGGYDGVNHLDSGGRYDPATDTWEATTMVGAPLGRRFHTAVWTGTEMIVWGGGYLDTGGRYDPATDTWEATTAVGAPAGRYSHTAVWTGTRMIVWGGYDGVNHLPTGMRYDPATDTWAATTLTNAPPGRSNHTAVWTGTQMIVWGGYDGVNYLTSGARYNPGTDTWVPIAGVVTGRRYHTAVWTGTQMIVWGGYDGVSHLATGMRYDPATDTWAATTLTNAPPGRSNHTAVWTGTRMIVWGGYNGVNHVNTGGRYDPAMDTWEATTMVSAPTGRYLHTAVWTGTRMIVWGGYDGANYLDSGGQWRQLSLFRKR